MEKRRELPKNEQTGKSNRARLERAAELYRTLDEYDRGFRHSNGTLLAGVDEAGRGALAGPVVAASVVLPADSGLTGVRDSKTVDENDRESLFEEIVRRAIAIGIACSSASCIDDSNILVATLSAMERAVHNLGIVPDLAIVDGRDIPHLPCRAVPVVGGDRSSLSIAAASILAKVARDRMMRKLHRKHPVYNFLKNKGYGTREHRAAIALHGTVPIHRKSYRVKSIENIPQLL